MIGRHFLACRIDRGAAGKVEPRRIPGALPGFQDSRRAWRVACNSAKPAARTLRKMAFGPFLRSEWLADLAQPHAAVSRSNLFIAYLTNFYPAVRAPYARAGVLTRLIGFLALVNYRGVTGGNRSAILHGDETDSARIFHFCRPCCSRAASRIRL